MGTDLKDFTLFLPGTFCFVDQELTAGHDRWEPITTPSSPPLPQPSDTGGDLALAPSLEDDSWSALTWSCLDSSLPPPPPAVNDL